MKSIMRQRESLSFAEKLSRLSGRLRDQEWRRYGATLLFGKVAGVGVLCSSWRRSPASSFRRFWRLTPAA